MTILYENNDLYYLKLRNLDFMNAVEWFQANMFMMNQEKTKEIIFSNKKDNIVANNDPVKFLGIWIQSNMTWSEHVDYVKSRLSRVTFLLRNLINYVTPHYIRCAYFSFFQSIIRYGLIFWGNCSRITEILVLQKKVIRILSKANWLEHCKPLYIKLRILTVTNLYIFDVLMYTLNNFNEYSLISDIHAYNTRNNQNIQIPNVRLKKTQISYKVLGMKIYNKLPKKYYMLPEDVFKERFYKWLLNHPFYSVDEFLTIPISNIIM